MLLRQPGLKIKKSKLSTERILSHSGITSMKAAQKFTIISLFFLYFFLFFISGRKVYIQLVLVAPEKRKKGK